MQYFSCPRGMFFCVVIATIIFSGCIEEGQDYASFIPAKDKYDVHILRDTWGVPHIFGTRDSDVAYGLGYAHSEDDYVYMEEAILTVRGELARKLGRDWAKFDYLVSWFRIREFTDLQYDRVLSAELRAVMEGYAEGITHFAALNPDKMPYIKLPVTGKEIIAGVMIKIPFFYDLHHALKKIMSGDGVTIGKAGVVAFNAMQENPFSRDLPIGSNAWAVGPSRSADGATRLAINSHMPWEGQLTWYEAQLHSEEGWDVIGGTFPGGPFIFKGHNANMGWCHTINRPGLADIYELTIHPDNPYLYELDGEWQELERGTAHIQVRLWGNLVIPVNKETLWSAHGPVVRQGERTLAIRFVGYGAVRPLEQWYRMNKAQNLEDFLAAMNMGEMLSFNTVYADCKGNLFYAYVGKFPVRSQEFDWNQILPGNTSRAIWTEYHPFKAIPQVLNPPSAFIQSCNSGPFGTTVGEGNPSPEQFTPDMRIEDHFTNRSLRALNLYGGDSSITREEFHTYKYDKIYDPASTVAIWLRDVLNAEVPEGSNLASAIELLRGWDLSGTRDRKETALAMLAMELGPSENAPMDASDALKRLRSAVDYMLEKHGRLDVPWGEMLRLRRGDVDTALGGCPDCLRAVDLKLQEDGRFVGINGDCFYQMVEWTADGKMRSESVHQYGTAASDEKSPHYSDQATLFASETMRPTLYYEEDIRANLVMEYRPGEFKGAWYANTQ
ncbi:MAG: penicillin acylase family protein [Candidatus Hydrogenedentes bacterium]|nr:penicillin acylase family protein [Candidatus Hydrogenedentota bacterium]